MSEKKSIRVMIVDDHEMVRDGLGLMLDTCAGLERAGEAKDGEAAILMCERLRPDVILMDLVMPGTDGLVAMAEILKRHPETKIIALTSFDTTGMVEKALKAGAISYIKKNVRMNDLAEAIHSAYTGKPTLSPEATQELIGTLVKPPQPGHDLTERERDVLELLVEGLKNHEIAERLVIADSTVKHHVSSVLAKLKAGNRASAVAIAMEHNLVN